MAVGRCPRVLARGPVEFYFVQDCYIFELPWAVFAPSHLSLRHREVAPVFSYTYPPFPSAGWLHPYSKGGIQGPHRRRASPPRGPPCLPGGEGQGEGG